MNSSATFCASSADAAFGPIVGPECRDGFDFTLTFEQSILVLSPAALLLLVAPFRLFSLYNAPVKVAGHRLRLFKLAAIALLAVLHLVLIVLWATQPYRTRLDRVSVAAACVSFASSLMSCALSYVEHAKSPRPSSLLNAFFLVSLPLDAALLRTLWLAPSSSVNESIPAVFTVAFSLKAVLVVLEGWSKALYLVGGAGVYSPEATAGLYARAVFAWVAPLLLTGFRRLLRPMDLFGLDEDMGAAGLNERFWWHWHQYKASAARKHRLIRCCITTLRWSIIAVVLPRLALLTFTICQPLILNRFLVFLDNASQSINIGYGLVAAYGLVYLGIAVSQALYWHRNARSVTMLRGVLVSAVFSKATEMSITATDDSAALTLMSSDVDVIVRAIREIHEFWANTIQIAVATWLLSIQIGYAASGPMIVSFVALLGTVFFSPMARKYQVSWLGKTQKRVGITSAMIGHIKSIKMSGLAHSLFNTVTSLRADEIKASRPFRVASSITSSIAQAPLLLSPVVAFALFQGAAAKPPQTLDATRLFSALSLIILSAQPLFWMFEVVLDLSAAFGAFERIETFLSQESRRDTRQAQLEAVPRVIQHDDTNSIELQGLRNNNSTDIVIEAPGTSISWSEARPLLRNITFTVRRGQLVLLLGPVASGKTTLLKALLGEVPHVSGRIALSNERLAWCEQTPWLVNQTIRENVVGYSYFDAELYQTVIRACDLEKDLGQLSQGDSTKIGSKGLALSGGQKQRVALARAVYSRPKVALFDDIFSGLDNQTAQRVFNNVFSEHGLLRQWGTTVLLTTQSVSFLFSADHIICLDKNGSISEQGSYDKLKTTTGYVQTLPREIDASPTSTTSERPTEEEVSVDGSMPQADCSSGHEQQDVRRQLGDSTVYRYYFSSIGGGFLFTLLALEIVWAFLESFPTIWLKFWTDDNTGQGDGRAGYYLGVYAALQIAAVVWFVLVLIAAKSGVTLHQRLLSTVIRFSQDIGMVDNHLPLGLIMTLASFFGVIAKAGLLAASTPYIAAALPLLGALYFYLQRGYLRTSRQLRLLDLEEKAPLYTQFLETLSGLTTIRAFGWGPAAIQANHALVDRSQRPFYLLIIVQRWLVLVLDLTTTALALLLVGLAVRLRKEVDVGLTGVSLVQLISLSETVNMLIQFWTSIETSIGAVARIKQFAEDSGEENLPGETLEPPQRWPNRGAIQITGLTASYGGDDSIKALDRVSLDIKPGEKIGICGRTGSGKSSLFLVLLRLLDPSSGNISIDDLPLASLRRDAIRSRLIALTQEQFTLPGTVCHNMDPLGINSRANITKALDLVGVDQKTEAMIKTVIETEFREHTVISITHRLDTIVDFDRVVVMEKGRAVEVGKPQDLLASNSRFKALWAARPSSKV
ncbi:Multidrug resistance-associated 1 [Fusarium albosuccineum]|uniref:Multidrug resistance-associated 1 n=1 Tax=Fusarium albosuccineum TaxID=1237068 RepID=A0A8H4L5D8_9HYPO|nr:Multidrug resistance-associated 1 [Fusarium albosuccineum]